MAGGSDGSGNISTSSFSWSTPFMKDKVSPQITEAELKECFDAMETAPEAYTGENFFDAIEWKDVTESPEFFLDPSMCKRRFSKVDCCGQIHDPKVLATLSNNKIEAYLTETPSSYHHHHLQFGALRHPVIFDTGASLGITFDKNDFDGPLTLPEGDLRLRGMAQGLRIEGIGTVTYTFQNGNDDEVEIKSNCFYIPKAKVHLLSPQRLFCQKQGVSGKYQGDETSFQLIFNDGPKLTIKYDENNHLPIGYASVGVNLPPTINPQANALVLDDLNQNLTAGQKLLLQWHVHFGHLNLRRVQSILRLFPFNAIKYASASKCDISTMKCATCQYAKAHRHPTHGATKMVNPDRDGSLTAENLTPGKCVSVDHFES